MLASLAADLRAMDAQELWIGSLIATGVALFLLWLSLRSFWRLRTVADTATARIRSAPQGYVELVGVAKRHRALTSGPLTRLPCVWYRYRVQEERGSGRHRRWVTIDRGEHPDPFVLDDDTGLCLVEPAGASFKCRSADVWYGGSRHTPKPVRAGWLKLRRRYRFREERIAEGEPVYLLGRFETPRRGDAEKRELVRRLLARWKRDPARVAALDRNGDGEIDLVEWERARDEAERIADRAEARLRAAPPMPRVFATGDGRQPFFISTLSQREILSHLRWHAYGGMLVSLVLAIGVVLVVTARLSGAPGAGAYG